MSSPDDHPIPPATGSGGEHHQALATEESSPESGSYRQRYRTVIHSLAGAFAAEGYSPGDLAQLRRLDYRNGYASTGDAFWRIAVRELEERRLLDSPDVDDIHRRWMAILQGLATLRDLHDPKKRLGSALASAGVSEARLTRLLNAHGDALLAQIRPLAHQLRSQAQRADWSEIADLVLGDQRHQADANDHDEKARQRIASGYYRQQYRDETSKDRATSAAGA